MFKNREFRVRMVKTPKETDRPEVVCRHIAPETINTIVKDQMKNAAILAGSYFILRTVLASSREIAYLAALKKFGS